MYIKVYKINCKECESSYVGRTKRQLGTRTKEHFSDIKKFSSPNVITKHRINENHEFDWKDVKIFDREASWTKRNICEMIVYQ